MAPALACLALLSVALAQTVHVHDTGSLRAAVAQAKPGARILIAPGDYQGLYIMDLHGTAIAPIVVAGEDPSRPPRFLAPIQFQRVSNIEFRDFAITGASGNAIGIDDGGIRETPASHIVLENLHIADVPGGGSNGIKMAGVDHFKIEKCAVERWGGCAVDLVGCHNGLIEGCRFEQGGGVGVQTKGGSSAVTVRGCDFIDFGGRGVNIGGSTGIPFFRPPLDKIPAGARYEAQDIDVEGCVFLRGGAPVSFTGVNGATVRFNTIIDPKPWAIRILQETATPDFVPSRRGLFADNLIVFKSDSWSEGGVNIGPGTDPKSFRFVRNWWYCSDHPERSRPTLPTEEKDGVVGRDPQLDGTRVKPGSPASKFGAGGLKVGRAPVVDRLLRREMGESLRHLWGRRRNDDPFSDLVWVGIACRLEPLAALT
ncbi:MAG TPA: right-handed parallel beta-helix repeat-containing protein [Fimbriimonadaceae bacterium]|nr:right-handed parallel beta-helix repeat-containing protein [Fimbriimonadaceae bacterium]